MSKLKQKTLTLCYYVIIIKKYPGQGPGYGQSILNLKRCPNVFYSIFNRTLMNLKRLLKTLERKNKGLE